MQGVATTGGRAPPPTQQEIQRKLSMHSQSSPNMSHRRKGSFSKSVGGGGALSGTESDSDASTFAPAPHPLVTDAPQQQATLAQAAITSPPLSVIAERRSPSGEETDDEEDDDWQAGDGRSVAEAQALDDEAISKTGYLSKKGERRKTWKKRWFVLRQTQLSYYKSDKEYQLLRLLPISEIHSVTPVSLKRHPHAFGIITPARPYYVEASSSKEVEDWVRALNEAKARLKEGGTTDVPNAGPTANKATVPVPISVMSGVNIPSSPRSPALVTTNLGTSPSPSSPIYAGQAANLTSSDSEDDNALSDSPATGEKPLRKALVAQPPQQTLFATPNKVILQGYLTKCGSKRRHWRKRWFVLTPEKLIYAKSHMDIGKAPGRGIKHIPLDKVLDAIECSVGKHGHAPGGTHHLGEKNASTMTPSTSGGGMANVNAVTNASAPPGAEAVLSSSPPTATIAGSDNAAFSQLPHTFKIITPKRTFLLCAPSEEEEIKWLSAVRAMIARKKGGIDEPTPGVMQPSGSVVGPQTVIVPSSPTAKRTRQEASSGSGGNPEAPAPARASRFKDAGALHAGATSD